MMATYLVSGGAGFIGSHIVDGLLARGDDVRVLDNFSTGNRDNLSHVAGKVDVIEGDICDADTVHSTVSGVDYVIHQAALASVPRSIEDPISTDRVNVQGTLNLLNAARNASVKRFVYASSSSAYGDSEKLPKVESMMPNPLSPYAVAKLAGEMYCGSFSEVYGIPTVSLRYFNVFGPRQDPNSQYAAVIPIFVKSLIEKQSPTIFGDGEQSRDFTFIDNVVRANLLACDGQTTGGKVYNVACGDRFTLNDLYRRLQTLMGVDVAAKYAAARVGDVKHSQASIDALRKELGFDISVDFEEGLKRTVEWYQKVGLANA